MVARFVASLQNTQAAQITLLYPEIAKQWHSTKNGELTPDKVLSNTTKKVWWLCHHGHEYEHSVKQRTSRTRVCPYCSGYRIGQGISFADKSPEAAAEWDYEKNKDKSPYEVFPSHTVSIGLNIS